MTILTTSVSYSATPVFIIQAENQLFEITLTGDAVAQPLTAVGILPPAFVVFQISQDLVGGHAFTWPANSVGGCTIGSGPNQVTTQMFVWNGANATAVGPCVIGNGPAINTGDISVAGTVTATGNITAPAFISNSANPAQTGVLRLENADTYCWRNTANTADVCWSKDASDNAVYPNSVIAATLQANTSFILNGSTPQTGVQGTDTNLLTAGTVSGTGSPLCTDANGGATTVGCSAGGTNAPQRVVLSAPITLVSNTQTIILTESVTFPTAAGTYRADVRYGAWITAANNACAAEAIDTTNNRAFALSGQDANGSGYIALSGSEISAGTYAAAATATFTLQIQCNAAQNVTANSGLFTFSPNEPTYLEVMPILSN